MAGLKSLVQNVKFYPALLILIVGFLHGGLYLLLIPPWQHYDEPTHFEYAWLIANHGSLPQTEEYDSGMRREVAASMIEQGFFRNLSAPNLLIDKPWIGISQTNDQPLYYLILAIPLWVLKSADITFQLYVGRIVSFIMFLCTLWVSYRVTIEIFPRNDSLKWLIPISMALTPAFVDLMTAVNNDVGATLFFSIFLWMGIRLIRHGMTISRVLLLIFSALVCYYTKNTVLLALPLTIFILLLNIFQAMPPWNRLAVPALLIFFGSTSVFLFSWQDAAFWYRSQISVQQNIPTQAQGAYDHNALVIHYSPNEKSEVNLSQPLTPEAKRGLVGKSYSLGAWIWASEPIQVQAPNISIDDNQATNQLIEVTQTPTFFTISGTIPDTAQQLRILLDPLSQPLDHPITIYFDDLVLAEGQYSSGSSPILSRDKSTGSWGNENFTNLVRNPSVEKKWLIFRPSVLFEFRTQAIIPSYALPAIQDWQLTRAIYRNTVNNLFESFWARFGWNHIGLPKISYFMLQSGSLLGIIGAIMGLVTQVHKLDVKQILYISWLMTCTFLIWSAAFARQTLPYWETNPFTPSARYAFPVIIPSSTVFSAGWYFIASCFSQTKILYYFPIAFLVILDITCLVVILQFYR